MTGDAPALSGTLDVVVVGAGAAGLGALARLADELVEAVALEARDRPGGRAYTLTGRSGAAIDQGCGWLHSADQNAWAPIAEGLGLTLDKSPPSWTRRAMDVNFPRADQDAYRAAFDAFEARLETAAAEPDRAAAELMDPAQGRWAPLLNAFSGYYNGAPFDEISVHDYAAYRPTEVNWRVREGYGALMGAFAADLPIAYGAEVVRVDHRGPTLGIDSSAGRIATHTVIITVPTAVLAHGGMRFDPPLPDKLEAAEALPLGHVNKAFLHLGEPEAYPIDAHLFGRTDTAHTGSYTLRPMGNPVVECFFGGRLAGDLEPESEGAFCAFAVDELVNLFGSDLRRRLRALTESRWSLDPFSRGAYSHARPGQAGMRAALAAPVQDRIFFAGEACSAQAFSTAHGAYETGVAAAEAALAAVVRGRKA